MTGVTKEIYCPVMLCNNLLMSTNILWNFDDSIKSDNNEIIQMKILDKSVTVRRKDLLYS